MTAAETGITLARAGRFAEALAAFDLALAAEPLSPLLHNNRGNVLVDLGRADEALAAFDRAVALDPSYALAYFNRGNTLSRLERYEDAVADFSQAIALKPDYVDARRNRGMTLSLLDRHHAALPDFDVVSAAQPLDPQIWVERGKTLAVLGRTEDASASFARAIEIEPRAIDAFINRGSLLLDLDRDHDALADFDQAFTLDPHSVAANHNRAVALARLRRYEDALESTQRTIALDPTCVEAHWVESLIRLLLGDFEAGFRKYEWRWQTAWLEPLRRDFTQPLWTGDADIAGRTILLHAEQGFGDTIQFCRYAQEVAALGATVLLEVHPVLMTLLDGLAGVTRLIAEGEPLPDFDFHCPLMSLPLAFKTRLDTIPSSHPYLFAQPDRIVRWSGAFRNTGRLRVGLAWAGRAGHQNDRHRSMPLATLLRAIPDGIDRVSLQKNIRPADLETLKADGEIIDCTAQIDDFSDTAAVVSLLDVVIAVDTATAHVAGALGVPTWLLLPYAADWRWLTDRSDSPWYPTMRIFRQQRAGDWDSVITEVRAALQAMIDDDGGSLQIS